jgi:hypothetical protein
MVIINLGVAKKSRRHSFDDGAENEILVNMSISHRLYSDNAKCGSNHLPKLASVVSGMSVTNLCGTLRTNQSVRHERR